MNEEDNAIFEELGAVSLINFKVADALLAGIEVGFVSTNISDGYVNIINALVIGQSANSQVPIDPTSNTGALGIITARSEFLTIKGAAFYNFPAQDINGVTTACFGTCSHCTHPQSSDSGARTIVTSGIRLDYTTVTTAIIYGYPFRDIFEDLDGSLTGLGPYTYATAFFAHNLQPECQLNMSYFNGIICNSSVQVRRIAFYGINPEIIFDAMVLHIQQYDAYQIGNLNSSQLTAYQLNSSSYGVVPFKEKVNPIQGWATPFVTGHKYRMHWGFDPLDWMNLNATQSERWLPSDLGVYIIMNFTDTRSIINVTAGDALIPNATLSAISVLPNGTVTDEAYWNNDTQWLNNSFAVTGYNIILNDPSSTQETHVLFNGRSGSNVTVQFSAARCNGPCQTQITTVNVSQNMVLWSDPKSWPKGRIPIKNDNVTIAPGVNMSYDIADSPILNYLEINGALTFKDNGTARTLSANIIFVREGQLLIGTKNNPYQSQASIVLYGNPSSHYVVFFNSIEAGNKILQNTNKIAFYGKQRQQMTRLYQEVYPNQSYIYVETGLDWSSGDRIALAPTSLIYTDVDYAVVQSYDPTTGQAILDRNLSAYHYGTALSSVSTYGFVIRGEVLLLSRNIQIRGDTSQNAWGCTILSSDFNDFGIQRLATTIFDNVEIYNCSQFDTLKAAMRFQSASGAWSSITNCSIHDGQGMGISILESSNLFFQNNNIFNFVRFGVYMETSSNITFDQNALVRVWTRGLVQLQDMFIDVSGGFVACAKNSTDNCSYSFTNNIAAGTFFAGFLVQGHECGNYSQTVFRGNLAHSSGGSGAVIFPNVFSNSQSTCMEASYFYAYKNNKEGIVASFQSQTQQFSHMVFVDNRAGAVINGNTLVEQDVIWAKMNNITIWGESPARDCLQPNYCIGVNPLNPPPGCVDRMAYWMPYFTEGNKIPMPYSASGLPLDTIDATGNWGGNSIMTNMNFIGFNSPTTYCGNSQTVINLNPVAPDYMPRVRFVNVTFTNVHQNAFAFLYSPDWEWANPDDCGNWPCSGPNNTFIDFTGVSFNGSLQPILLRSYNAFQILPMNSLAVGAYTNCQSVLLWNAYFCRNPNFGILLFESQDTDKSSRMVAPVTISNNLISSQTTINQFMDHTWDGFYTGQVRLARFPSIVQLSAPYAQYTVAYTGTPPAIQRFTLITSSQYGMIVTIQFPVPGRYNLLDINQKIIQSNPWNDQLQSVSPVQGISCGENSYTGVVDILQFYVTPACLLFIQNQDSILCSVRLQWTLSQFYADGGSTTFADRMAAVLGIQPQDIKVVAIYEGSVIVVQNIVLDSSEAKGNYQDLTQMQNTLMTLFNSGKVNVGAFVMSATVNNIPISLQPTGYNYRTNNTSTNSNQTVYPTNPPVTNKTDNNSNQTNSGQKIVTIDTNKTEVIIQTSSSSSQASNTMIIVFVTVLALVIVLGGIIGFVIYKKFGKAQVNPATPIPDDSTLAQTRQSHDVANDTETEMQFQPKEQIGKIIQFQEQLHRTNCIKVVDNNDVTHMSEVKILDNQDNSIINTYQFNFTDGDKLNHFVSEPTREITRKATKKDQLPESESEQM